MSREIRNLRCSVVSAGFPLGAATPPEEIAQGADGVDQQRQAPEQLVTAYLICRAPLDVASRSDLRRELHRGEQPNADPLLAREALVEPLDRFCEPG